MRYDVRASCLEIDGPGGDGAYSLIGDSLTPEQVAESLLKVLRDGFGLSHAGPCRLDIHIGPAGSGDNLPL